MQAAGQAPAVVGEAGDGEPLHDLEVLVRSPSAFVDGAATASPAATRRLLATIALGGAVFGAVIGGFRGGAQIAYAAVKVPVFLLATLSLAVPAFMGIARAFEVRISLRELVSLSLGATARLALVLVGLAPVLWLLEGVSSYHGMAVWVTAAMLVAGLSAVALLFSGLARRGTYGKLAGVAMIAVYAVIGAQTSWMLRPFLVRPRTEHVPFLRHVEGDLFGSVRTSVRSMTGSFNKRSGDWTESREHRGSSPGDSDVEER